MDFYRTYQEATPLLLEGVKMTVAISLLSIAIGIVIGLITCFFAISKLRVLRGIAGVYVWIVRGTPMIVQAFIVYFGVPQLIQVLLNVMQIDQTVRISPFMAGGITLSLNAGAYLSEIFRGGIGAVSRGQVEAARSLGLSGARTMVKIVLPQAFKITLPSLVNQFIITIKDTSILSVIGLADLMFRTNDVIALTFKSLACLAIAALCYFAMTFTGGRLIALAERKMNHGK